MVFSSLTRRFNAFRDRNVNRKRLRVLTRQIAALEQEQGTSGQPVVVFNASTRLGDISLNAAYSLLAAWGLRANRRRVIHFVCQAGMSRCMLGASEDDYTKNPPCTTCTAMSREMYQGAEVYGFSFHRHAGLITALNGMNVADLETFEYEGIPFGQIVLPSIRWRMRCHHLNEDKTTLVLFREFIESAYWVGREFEILLEREKPAAVLVFNGQMFPEAMARYMAQRHNVPVFSHETGLLPYTAFTTTGEATARRLFLTEEDLTLNPAQNEFLDAYLNDRFQGRFSMGGIQFWQGMQQLDEDFEKLAAGFKQVVPIFTNVIFDTSQAHANTIFPHMFAWLDQIHQIAKDNPDTLFILRAHPDEMRANSRKKSRETVAMWVQRTGAADLPNLTFIDSQEFVSSYDLIGRAKFVLAYNSSIALEATILGKQALCGGWAWYSEYPTVLSPSSAEAYRQEAQRLLDAEQIVLPETNRQNARALLYYEYFRASIPFQQFVEDHVTRGYVRLLPVETDQFVPQNAPLVASLLEGLAEAPQTEDEFVLTIPDIRA